MILFGFVTRAGFLLVFHDAWRETKRITSARNKKRTTKNGAALGEKSRHVEVLREFFHEHVSR